MRTGGCYGTGRRLGRSLFAALARLTLAMIPLGILVLVEQERHAYTIAGVVSGAYAIGAALGTPVLGAADGPLRPGCGAGADCGQ